MSRQNKFREIANSCLNQYGFYPISFSYPRLHLTPQNKTRSLSSIIPGVPYTFNSYDEYIKEYTNSALGITHKKAGWDCFRHLEIMYAGAIPYMADINEIPEFTMAQYPKEFLKIVAKYFEEDSRTPSESLQFRILEHFDTYLTTLRMVQNILDLIGSEPKSILFLDDAVIGFPDYLSNLTLIGLKQNYGKNCFTFSEPNYLYDDFSGDSTSLYGKGFGYTKVLDSKFKSSVPRNVEMQSFDLVVVGSLARNLELANLVEKSNVPALFLYGEDLPPNSNELALIHNSNAKTFVREVY